MGKNDNFTIVVWKEDAHFVAQCLNVDVSSFGNSYEEALENVREAIELYLEDDDAEVSKIEMPAITVSHLNLASNG